MYIYIYMCICLIAIHGNAHTNRVARTMSVLQCVALCCSVLQCVALCCSMLQCGVARQISNYILEFEFNICNVCACTRLYVFTLVCLFGVYSNAPNSRVAR